MAKAFILHSEGYGTIRECDEDEAKTIEDAIEKASEWASANERKVRVFQAVREIKPQRAPVEVVTL